jgi:hypothetical protein
MAFVTDKAELKPGLVLFRRGDVDHRMWYCRMKIPKADRYKTVSLKMSTPRDLGPHCRIEAYPVRAVLSRFFEGSLSFVSTRVL